MGPPGRTTASGLRPKSVWKPLVDSMALGSQTPEGSAGDRPWPVSLLALRIRMTSLALLWPVPTVLLTRKRGGRLMVLSIKKAAPGIGDGGFES